MPVPRFDIDLTESQRRVRESIEAICDDFDHEYTPVRKPIHTSSSTR